jgi:hypothetical protein
MDIVERLRRYSYGSEVFNKLESAAADEIERLRHNVQVTEGLLDQQTELAAQRLEEIERLRKERDELLALLERYRNETPVGHQPHMICHVVDAAIAKVKGGE